MDVELTVYLSGEIHTEWREDIANGVDELDLPVDLTGPVTDHAASDDCGVTLLGQEAESFWKDHKGAKLNAIRTRTLIGEADLVVIRFGEKYRQWNAACDAGYAAAMKTPYIVMHSKEHAHALKEVDAEAFAVCETPEQVVGILRYLTRGELVRPTPSLSVVR
ncbi:MAG: YtoQ family protein [Pseudomonadota bacterium]